MFSPLFCSPELTSHRSMLLSLLFCWTTALSKYGMGVWYILLYSKSTCNEKCFSASFFWPNNNHEWLMLCSLLCSFGLCLNPNIEDTPVYSVSSLFCPKLYDKDPWLCWLCLRVCSKKLQRTRDVLFFCLFGL